MMAYFPNKIIFEVKELNNDQNQLSEGKNG